MLEAIRCCLERVFVYGRWKKKQTNNSSHFKARAIAFTPPSYMGSGRPLETHQRRATGHTTFAKTRCRQRQAICSLWKVPPAVRLLNGPGARADVSRKMFLAYPVDPFVAKRITRLDRSDFTRSQVCGIERLNFYGLKKLRFKSLQRIAAKTAVLDLM